MRYQPQKTTDLFIAVLLLIGVAIIAVMTISDPLFSGSEKLMITAICCVPLLVISGIMCCYAFRSGAYALIEEDGIHIFSRKQGELVFAPWTDARDCRQSGIWTASAAMLVFRYDATVCGKPLASYPGHPQLKYKEAKEYLLDELMFRLARGKMTAEEFRNLPLLFLVTDGFKKDEYQKYHSMWRAAKDRAAEQEESK